MGTLVFVLCGCCVMRDVVTESYISTRQLNKRHYAGVIVVANQLYVAYETTIDIYGGYGHGAECVGTGER